jgi:hypothetical protein
MPSHRGGSGPALVCLRGFLDGVGHCPQLDVPLETAQLILGFTAP